MIALTPRAELSAELVGLLDHSITDHLGPTTVDHDLVMTMCTDAVTFAREYSPRQVGMRARSASSLLLDLACPQMSADLRQELSVVCELTAIGAIARTVPLQRRRSA